MCSYLDFIYLGQYSSHSSETLQYLDQALKSFHSQKGAISKSGARDGPRQQGKFNIKKLELMQHVSRLIKLLGAADQFTTDQTEHCHITMAKIPYCATNKKDFSSQMCCFINREEKINLFSGWLEWWKSKEIDLHDSHPAVNQLCGFHLTDKLLRCVNKFQTITGISMAPIHNYFKSSSLPTNETTAFHIPTRITAKTSRSVKFLDYMESLHLMMPYMTIEMMELQTTDLISGALTFGVHFVCNVLVNKIKKLFYHHKLYKHCNQVPNFLLAGVM